MNKKKKLVFLLFLLGVMIYYVGWVFYISEPKYIDNAQTYGKEFPTAGEVGLYPLHTYDFVVVPTKGEFYTDDKNNVITGMVLQVDDKHAFVKRYAGGYSWDDYFDLIIDKSHYRVIGKGTLYHKVNHYIGFNIMFITQMIIGVLIAVLIWTTSITFANVLKDNGLLG
jgi:hypothetical protein